MSNLYLKNDNGNENIKQKIEISSRYQQNFVINTICVLIFIGILIILYPSMPFSIIFAIELWIIIFILYILYKSLKKIFSIIFKNNSMRNFYISLKGVIQLINNKIICIICNYKKNWFKYSVIILLLLILLKLIF